MKYAKSILSLGTFLLFNACTSHSIPKSAGGYYYKNIYFGQNLPKTYVKGIKDGCNTSIGIYTKSHWLFKNKNEYENGWFLGRNKCKNLLRIDKNGDLIL